MTNKFNLAITKASNTERIEHFAQMENLNGVVFYGRGSAQKSFWSFLGLTDNSKVVFMYKDEISVGKLMALKKECKDIYLAQIGGSMTKERLFICIINSGFADEIMNIARDLGTTGGTILDGRGTGRSLDTIMGTAVDSAKEILLIFCAEDLAKNLENKIGEYIEKNESVSGICFTLNAKLYKELNVNDK